MNIVFIAHGSKESQYQVLFCLLTLYFYWNGDFKNVKIIIYTDNSFLFNKYKGLMPIITEILSSEDIKRFRGNNNYVHRIKPCVFKEYFSKYKEDLFYLDSDTFFTKDPSPIISKVTEEISVMNVNESDLLEAGNLENINWLNLRIAIRDNSFSLKENFIKIPLTVRLWNSGVAGISYKCSKLLDDVIEITDQVYTIAKVFYVEQFALSYILQNNTKIVDSEDYIYHYWERIKDKKMFDYYLKIFFNENINCDINTLAQEAHDLSAKYNTLIPAYLKTPLTQRIFHRIKLIKQVAITGRL